MQVKVLILEDMHERHVEFHKRMHEVGISDYTIVEDADSCIANLKLNNYDIIFLDHDLNNEVYVSTMLDNTGSGVVRWIVENQNNKQALFVLHSLNHGGRENMKSLLFSGQYKCFEVPFVWTRDVFHKNIKIPH